MSKSLQGRKGLICLIKPFCCLCENQSFRCKLKHHFKARAKERLVEFISLLWQCEQETLLISTIGFFDSPFYLLEGEALKFCDFFIRILRILMIHSLRVLSPSSILYISKLGRSESMPLFLGLPKLKIIIVENLKDILYHDNILMLIIAGSGSFKIRNPCQMGRR